MTMSVSCNDIVAVLNQSISGFHIGQVVNVNANESLINVTLFHYKMDTEMISATKDDVIMNFGQHQAKSIFKMSDDQQKMLLDQLIERRSDSSSLLSLIAQLETTNRALSKVEMNIEKLLDRLFIEADCAAVIEQIIHDEIVDREKITSLIFRRSRESNAEAQLHLLAKTLATLCLKTQSLDYIERQMGTISDDVPNSTERIFIRKTLLEIGGTIGASEVNQLDSQLLRQYARLCSIALKF